MSQFYNDSIFWVDVDKIKPNPFQPRRDFDEMQLQSLSDSIRQYGVLQALVVTRKEVQRDDGGLSVEYELIAGERRLRASKLAGLSQVPVLIKVGEDVDGNNLMKLELAIIENVQREDLNPVDRARAFQRLADEFGFKHHVIAQKIGKSRGRSEVRRKDRGCEGLEQVRARRGVALGSGFLHRPPGWLFSGAAPERHRRDSQADRTRPQQRYLG
jgi:ParB/RepB/Spo0J family partition protein